MTAIQRIDNKIAALRSEYAALTRGCAVVTPKARKVADRIARLNEERLQIAVEQRHSLGSLLPKDPDKRNEIYHKLVKLPLIADFLYSACVDLSGTLAAIGLNELTMMEQVSRMKNLSKELAFSLSQFPELENILSADDSLISALDKKVDSFLTRKMKITK